MAAKILPLQPLCLLLERNAVRMGHQTTEQGAQEGETQAKEDAEEGATEAEEDEPDAPSGPVRESMGGQSSRDS